jgi:hypothetical protein
VRLTPTGAVAGLSLVNSMAGALTSLSNMAREYRVHATTAWALADAATDSSAKKLYLDFERYWLGRALDYDSAELVLGRARRRALSPSGHTPRPIVSIGRFHACGQGRLS